MGQRRDRQQCDLQYNSEARAEGRASSCFHGYTYCAPSAGGQQRHSRHWRSRRPKACLSAPPRSWNSYRQDAATSVEATCRGVIVDIRNLGLVAGIELAAAFPARRANAPWFECLINAAGTTGVLDPRDQATSSPRHRSSSRKRIDRIVIDARHVEQHRLTIKQGRPMRSLSILPILVLRRVFRCWPRAGAATWPDTCKADAKIPRKHARQVSRCEELLSEAKLSLLSNALAGTKIYKKLTRIEVGEQ